jgi:2-methylcitrate dehydratase PrpD
LVNDSNSREYTDRLVRFVAELDYARLDPCVRHECLRAFLNALGCAVGGSRHRLVDIAAAALLEFSGQPQATVLGRKTRADTLTAALLNGLSAAAYSFDDTYSDALLHPSGPVAAALLGIAERSPISGPNLMAAFAAGIEVACRLTRAVAVPPAKGELAWSQTGIACGIAASLACAKLLGLDREAMSCAAGIALTESGGTRAAHGTMAASWIFGRAAQAGTRAALLAARGFSGPRAPIEHRHGYAAVFAQAANMSALVEGLGETYELLSNTYKPYPCGSVIHAAIDGVLELRNRLGYAAADVTGIRLRVSHLAVALGMRRHPANDLEAKVSMHHWVAASVVRGKAGLSEGTMSIVEHPEVRRLREAIEIESDTSIAQDAAVVSVRLKDGQWHSHRVEHCSGSREAPMSDQALEAKFVDQAKPILGKARTSALLRACWALPSIDDAAELARLAG